jgi:hypothetical protein
VSRADRVPHLAYGGPLVSEHSTDSEMYLTSTNGHNLDLAISMRGNKLDLIDGPLAVAEKHVAEDDAGKGGGTGGDYRHPPRRSVLHAIIIIVIIIIIIIITIVIITIVIRIIRPFERSCLRGVIKRFSDCMRCAHRDRLRPQATDAAG